MADLKTIPTGDGVEAFLASMTDETRRQDCVRVLDMMRHATGAEPVMWGTSMVGFGSYHYTYESGREGDWFVTGFAPRTTDLTLYIMPGVDRYENILSRLGKYKTGRSCLYIKRLSDVDVSVLQELVSDSVKRMKGTYGA